MSSSMLKCGLEYRWSLLPLDASHSQWVSEDGWSLSVTMMTLWGYERHSSLRFLAMALLLISFHSCKIPCDTLEGMLININFGTRHGFESPFVKCLLLVKMALFVPHLDIPMHGITLRVFGCSLHVTASFLVIGVFQSCKMINMLGNSGTWVCQFILLT